MILSNSFTNLKKNQFFELIINDNIMQTQDRFNVNDYCNMIRSLQLKKLDLNSLSIHRALEFIKEAIHITDMDIVGGLVASKMTSLPYWLEAHGNLVNRTKQKLETNIFPTNTFHPIPPRPHKPVQFLEWRNLKSQQSSTKSMKKGTKQNSVH